MARESTCNAALRTKRRKRLSVFINNAFPPISRSTPLTLAASSEVRVGGCSISLNGTLLEFSSSRIASRTFIFELRIPFVNLALYFRIKGEDGKPCQSVPIGWNPGHLEMNCDSDNVVFVRKYQNVVACRESKVSIPPMSVEETKLEGKEAILRRLIHDGHNPVTFTFYFLRGETAESETCSCSFEDLPRGLDSFCCHGEGGRPLYNYDRFSDPSILRVECAERAES